MRKLLVYIKMSTRFFFCISIVKANICSIWESMKNDIPDDFTNFNDLSAKYENQTGFGENQLKTVKLQTVNYELKAAAEAKTFDLKQYVLRAKSLFRRINWKMSKKLFKKLAKKFDKRHKAQI